MKRVLSTLFCASALALGLTACVESEKAREPVQGKGDAGKSDPGPRRPPRPAFTKRKITVGKKEITVEVADTEHERTHGLMFVESMPDDEGMLFIFEFEQPLSFWMKNTLIPLAIAYIDEKGRVVDIQEMVPASPSDPFPKTYPSARPAKYALEMNKGWFERNAIKVGSFIKL